ncbi:MAG TPA: ribbon-helix-helix domain-containing protein [Steroidobacteraceae bacterium]
MVSKPKGNQKQVMGYYSPEVVKRLKALSVATRVPQAAYLREALDDLLNKHAAALRKAAK